MPDYNRARAVAYWNTAGVGTNAGVTVTKAAVASQSHVVEHISGSGDAAALVTVEFPAGTVVWRKRFAAAFTFDEEFPPGLYEAGTNVNAVLKISASTANCEANLAGYTVARTA